MLRQIPDFDARTPYLGKRAFRYDAEQNVSLCPKIAKYTERAIEYRANAVDCNACLMKAQCTGSDHGRMIHRSFDEAYLDRVRGYHETEEYQQAMRKRKVWIEPLFGEAKQWYGIRQFRLCGLQKVNMEGLFVAAGQNLKRLLSATGWGRCTWPDGAAGFADLTAWNGVALS